MATRAAIVSPEHVQALNMIDLEFRGRHYRDVTTAWKTYLDDLNSFPQEDEKLQAIWVDHRNEFLTKLLLAMGGALGYRFDEVQVRKGIYSPQAHGRIEDENTSLRRGLLELLTGKRALKMDVTSFPVSEQEVQEQKALRDGFQELLDGKRVLQVAVSPKPIVPENR